MVDSSACFCLDSLRLILVGLDQVLDPHVEFGCGKRLCQEIARAGRKRGQLGFLVRARRQQDDGNALGRGALAEFAASLQSVLFRHHHVQQDDVGQELASFLDGLLAIDRLEHVIVLVQLRFQKPQHVRLVIGDQNAGQVAITRGFHRTYGFLDRGQGGE